MQVRSTDLGCMHEGPVHATVAPEMSLARRFHGPVAHGTEPAADNVRYVDFARSRRDAAATSDRHRTGLTAPLPVEDVDKYAHAENGPEDYRHRMLVNGAAAAVCLLLIAGGVWISATMAQVRRDQDCVLSGRLNCAHISVIGSSIR